MRMLVVALAISVWAIDAKAAEEDKLAQARSYFEAGKQLFEAGKYGPAATAFSQSYDLVPKQATIYSMAQANRLQYLIDREPARLKEAVRLYQKYLSSPEQATRRDDALEHLASLEPALSRVEEEQRRQGRSIEAPKVQASLTQLMISTQVKGARAAVDGGAPAELPYIGDVQPGMHAILVEAEGYFPEKIDQLAVEGRLVVVDAKLRERPARLVLDAPDGAEIAVGGRPVGEAPLAAPIDLPAGRHFLTVVKSGRHPHLSEIAVKRGEDVRLEIDLDTTTQRKIAYGFLAGSAALLAGGVVGTVAAFGAESDAKAIIERRDRGENISLDDARRVERRIEDRDRWANISTFLYGGAVAAGVTSFLLWAIDTPRVTAPPERSFEIAPSAGPDGAGMSLTYRMN
jgi:hypothetical protein